MRACLKRFQAVARVRVVITREFLDPVAEQALFVAAIKHGHMAAAIERIIDLVRPRNPVPPRNSMSSLTSAGSIASRLRQ